VTQAGMDRVDEASRGVVSAQETTPADLGESE
jgi:hypothetical protein